MCTALWCQTQAGMRISSHCWTFSADLGPRGPSGRMGEVPSHLLSSKTSRRRKGSNINWGFLLTHNPRRKSRASTGTFPVRGRYHDSIAIDRSLKKLRLRSACRMRPPGIILRTGLHMRSCLGRPRDWELFPTLQ